MLEAKSSLALSAAGNDKDQGHGEVVLASQKKTSATAEAETAAMNGITRTLGLSEQMKLDWLLSRVYVSMFPSEGVSDITFAKYLRVIAWWRRRSIQNKIECKV
jgi:hypothetical protein